jgi:hypothetical protein
VYALTATMPSSLVACGEPSAGSPAPLPPPSSGLPLLLLALGLLFPESLPPLPLAVRVACSASSAGGASLLLAFRLNSGSEAECALDVAGVCCR